MDSWNSHFTTKFTHLQNRAENRQICRRHVDHIRTRTVTLENTPTDDLPPIVLVVPGAPESNDNTNELQSCTSHTMHCSITSFNSISPTSESIYADPSCTF